MELFIKAEEEGHVYKNIAMLNQMVMFPSLEGRVAICAEIFIFMVSFYYREPRGVNPAYYRASSSRPSALKTPQI